MIKFFCIAILSMGTLSLKGQVVFKTILSQQTVVMGESFQIQFILEENDRLADFTAPDLQSFRIVSGPNTYKGSMVIKGEVKSVKNLVYTLTPLSIGYHKIRGAVLNYDQETIQSNDVNVEVISKDEALKRVQKNGMTINSEYFLRPGEDPYKKINDNLFVKVLVDQRTCYVGQPVQATFKLYSRLESKSDIVKNPGFYGFTVYDMVNLADKLVTTESFKGKLFDVHTIRKVQLYPLQAGDFTIDEMEVKNKVEFSKSIVNKQTEQEIVEGILNVPDDTAPVNVNVFETDISTVPISIHVKPVPVRNKPEFFNGATGQFSIQSEIIKHPDSRNSEGIIKVSITGKGNFIQLDAPMIKWPPGLEGLEPAMNDSLDKTVTPLMGTRIFRYSFIANKTGEFTLDPVSFSFFNPDTGTYKTVSTGALHFSVKDEEQKITTPLVPAAIKLQKVQKRTWVLIGLGLLLCSAVLIFYLNRKKSRKTITVAIPLSLEPAFSIDELLSPATQSAETGDPGFYQQLQKSIWNFAGHHFKLSGSGSNKSLLVMNLQNKQVDEDLIANLLEVIHQCEEGVFGNFSSSANKKALVDETKTIMEKIHAQLL